MIFVLLGVFLILSTAMASASPIAVPDSSSATSLRMRLPLESKRGVGVWIVSSIDNNEEWSNVKGLNVSTNPPKAIKPIKSSGRPRKCSVPSTNSRNTFFTASSLDTGIPSILKSSAAIEPLLSTHITIEIPSPGSLDSCIPYWGLASARMNRTLVRIGKYDRIFLIRSALVGGNFLRFPREGRSIAPLFFFRWI